MPCLGSIISTMGDMYGPESLHKDLCGKERLLLVDCRSCAEYSKSRIGGAVNVTLPSLMLKRLKKGTLNISCVIQNNVAKEKFKKSYKSHLLVLYDDCTTDVNTNPSGVLSLLLKQLKGDGCDVKFLLGGFSTFEERFPECCVSQEDQEADILGLCNLKITDQSGEYSEGRCSDSATPPHLSPFPVQVLPNLYLGNARNSADISQLKQYGIRYILNVTPNVPNLFETDRSFKYMQIPISDHWSQNLSSFFPEAIAFIDEARKNNCGVLVHCLAGISRSVTVTVAYLMQREHKSLNEAYDFVKRCKPNISPNFNFMGQLLDFERALGHSEEKCVCADSIGCTCGVSKTMLLSDSKENSPNYTIDVRPA